MIQLREKELDKAAFLAEARELQKLCREFSVPLIINDEVEIALACGAAGVHVGQEDMPVEQVRALVGEQMIIGVSAETKEEALRAVRGGADYLGVGAVFPTSTKLDAQAVTKETLREICRSVSVPVCAIGGISRENILELKGTGIQGVALVSAVFAAGDIRSACRELKKSAEQVAAS